MFRPNTAKFRLSRHWGFPEAVWFESRDHIEFLFGSIVVGFGLGGRDVSDWAKQAVMVEPIYPAQGCHFHR